ncbi:MAG: DUF4386 domain-containing protein [Dehalococcoidia bacterium]
MRTARTTGLLYLAFFILGILGSVLVRSELFAADNPQGTLSNLLEHESLARAGIALELGIALVQALTAVWFYRLFRGIDTFAAGSLAAFGMVNAIAIMSSGALLATALDAAQDTSLAAPGGAAATVQLLYVTSDNLWGVAAMFFGLWLIPMGWLAIRSGWLPRALGWVLIVGGIAYLASAFVRYVFADADSVAELLTVPSIIGELWIMAHLVILGSKSMPWRRRA